MRLGLLTAPFPETPLMEVADWTAANGFESLEIACWPRATGPTRRYAGTSHLDVANLIAGQATEIGYDGDVIIEHEDRDFEKTDDLIKRGFLLSRDILRPSIK